MWQKVSVELIWHLRQVMTYNEWCVTSFLEILISIRHHFCRLDLSLCWVSVKDRDPECYVNWPGGLCGVPENMVDKSTSIWHHAGPNTRHYTIIHRRAHSEGMVSTGSQGSDTVERWWELVSADRFVLLVSLLYGVLRQTLSSSWTFVRTGPRSSVCLPCVVWMDELKNFKRPT